MAIKIQYEGKFDLRTLKTVLRLMREKLTPGEEYKFYITDKKKMRTIRQNRYLWFVYGWIGNHLGIEPEDLHEICKKKFNLQVKQLGEKVYEFAGSTRLFNTKEMTDYIEKVRLWSLEEFDHYVPQANEIPEDILIDIISKR